MIKSTGERCSWCEQTTMLGSWLLEGDGAEFFCSVDCQTECDAARDHGCPAHVRRREWVARQKARRA